MPYLVRGKARSRINRRRVLSETPMLHQPDNIIIPDNVSVQPVEEDVLSEIPDETQPPEAAEVDIEDMPAEDEEEMLDESDYWIQPVGEPVSITEYSKETMYNKKKKRR
jgi:hypothetical protein